MSVTYYRDEAHRPENGDYVRVYWNVHRKLYSVQYKGKVVAHTTDISLEDVTFIVRKAGREKVLRENRKNVHAFVCGKICPERLIYKPVERVHYNPYQMETFQKDDGTPVEKCEKINLTSMRGGAIMWVERREVK